MRLGLGMYIGDVQDTQDEVVRAPASGRNFFFCDGTWETYDKLKGTAEECLQEFTARNPNAD